MFCLRLFKISLLTIFVSSNIIATEFIEDLLQEKGSFSSSGAISVEEQNMLIKLRSKTSSITQSELDKSLLIAAKKGWLEVMKFIAAKDHGLTVLPANNKINWALNTAAARNHLAIVNYMLTLPDGLRPSQDGVNWAFSSATKKGHLPVIESLMVSDSSRSGPNLKIINKALISTINQGKMETANALLQLRQKHQHGDQNTEDDLDNFQSIVDFLLAPKERRTTSTPLRIRTAPDDSSAFDFFNLFDELAEINDGIVNFAGQEAIIADSTTIIDACLKMFEVSETATIVRKLLPTEDVIDQSFEEFNALFSQQLLVICSASSKKAKFKIAQAQRSLRLLSGDESIERHSVSKVESYQNYSLHGLPNARQMAVLAYNLMTRHLDIENFVKTWLVERYRKQSAWLSFQRDAFKFYNHDFALGQIMKQQDIASAILFDERAGKSAFVGSIVQMLKGESDHMVMPAKNLIELVKAYGSHLNDQLYPLIDALFMIMRGHNCKILNEEECNSPACAKGAYLGILKIFGEIAVIRDIVGESHFAGVDIVDCGEA